MSSEAAGLGVPERARHLRPASVRSAPAAVRSLVARYEREVNRSVLLAIPRGEPQRYHYGPLAEYPLRAGKGLRPALCLAACAAHGGRVQQALPVAVALELLHNAFLVHDDLQDGSPLRRGRPALHERHGLPLAVNVGDGLAALAASHLHAHVGSLGPARAVVVLEAFDEMVRETLEGQALDLGWRRDNRLDLTLADYLSMVTKKTAWYSCIQPVRLGVLAASPAAATNPALIRFGTAMGTFFQLANDVAGLARVATGGQAAAEDLYEGKRTLPLVHLAGELDGAERRQLQDVLGRPRSERRDDEVAWLHGRLEAAGSIEYARSCVWAMAEVAQREAELAFGGLPPSPDRDLLLGIVGFVADAVT